MINLHLLPRDYLEFKNKTTDVVISNEYNYFQLYPLEELEEVSTDLMVNEFAPNFIIIGSNGSGTALAFHKVNWKIYAFEFIGMNEEDAVLVADSFSDFFDYFKKGEIEIY